MAPVYLIYLSLQITRKNGKTSQNHLYRSIIILLFIYHCYYDGLDRYSRSIYAERSVLLISSPTCNIGYNTGGNLLALKRDSATIEGGTRIEFDNLAYT
ncbi:hypothetical protein [Mucilaginibacter pocheonensis]|uniref:Uncharacterized protein n=1 Tax=Mucilaginibacter pocheonensis TaxID=398050 RepID=A0ABU1TBZ2_9SPHI|nr:hypothetical protein [Mucilaginibacter pocheonensis]MDR6942909.1 hypothetical protein [Mucilaginibacter pocheonensis]